MLRLSSALFLGAGACALAIACGGSSGGSNFTDGGASSGGGSGGAGGSGGSSGSLVGGSGSGGSSGGVSDNCSAAAKLVYVLSEQNDLYSFDPPNKKFTKIGALGCKAGTMTPNSMAVSRDAVAWVNYVQQSGSASVTNGGIFKVSTADASCQATNIQLPSQWYHLGMGYSTDSATSTSETLFIAATGTGAGLGTLDVTSGKVTPVGTFTPASLAGKDAELTGTGDGRLYGFFVDLQAKLGSSPAVAEIAKATAATSNAQTMTGVSQPTAWAFSFWGGDFYLYTNTNDPSSSDVTHYSPSTGAIDTAYMTGVGFTIVGAGVSTCAPTAPPK